MLLLFNNAFQYYNFEFIAAKYISKCPNFNKALINRKTLIYARKPAIKLAINL